MVGHGSGRGGGAGYIPPALPSTRLSHQGVTQAPCWFLLLQASGVHRLHVKELSQQLEQQRDMFTRRVRDLEAKLAAATAAARGASAASSRRASSTATATAREGLRKNSTAGSSRRDSHAGPEMEQQQQQLSLDSSFEAAAQMAADTAAVAATAAAAAADGAAQSQPGASSVLQLRERQLAALSAQLEERTTQVCADVLASGRGGGAETCCAPTQRGCLATLLPS